jgi:hypothetical protein
MSASRWMSQAMLTAAAEEEEEATMGNQEF